MTTGVGPCCQLQRFQTKRDSCERLTFLQRMQGDRRIRMDREKELRDAEQKSATNDEIADD